MDLRKLLSVLRRRWPLVLIGLLAGAGVGVAVIAGSTPMYASTARLFVSTPGGDSANSQVYQGSLFSQERVTSYANLVKGSTIADKVVRRMDSGESPAALVGQISAKATPDTVILEITATDADPLRAQQIAQTTAEVFTEYVPELESADDPTKSPIHANIVDAAGLPSSPVSPKPLLTIGLGGIVGLLLGLAAAWLRETWDTTIKSPEEAQELTGGAPLGSVEFDPKALKWPLIVDMDTHSPRAESFRMLRTNLQYLGVDRTTKTYAITSPLPGDGKSTTSINIALALAHAGRRTLLIEADLRRPKIGEYLQLERAVGLTTVLIGKCESADAIQPWGTTGLDVMLSGGLPPNPAELLQSRTMEALIEQLRQTYDAIVIDAPPILPVTDAALIATHADGAILVLRHGRTTRDQVVLARQHLDAVGAVLLGTVLNFVPRRSGTGYAYGYGYYDGATGERPALLATGAGRSAQRTEDVPSVDQARASVTLDQG